MTGLLIARSKFLQRNVYASMLKEKDTCQIKTNERSQPLLWLLFSLKLTTFYTFKSFVWPKKSDRLLDSLASPYLTAGWYGLNFYRDKF